MDEIIFVVTEDPEGGYTARALAESIFTAADDLPSLRARVRDAVRCHFEKGARRPSVPSVPSITSSACPLCASRPRVQGPSALTIAGRRA